MGQPKPFRRTCRAFVDGEYDEGGRSEYIKHSHFAVEPEHYIRAFNVLQKDIIELFDYIEPADVNNPTYSYRTHALLMRVCTEIEANMKAIFVENALTARPDDLTMSNYKRLNTTHHLSSYQVRVPTWRGTTGTRIPFFNWTTGEPLPWYRAYNESKHDRHREFEKANFESLIDAMCGLVALLAAQFLREDFANEGYLVVGGRPNDGFESAIGGYFLIKFPSDWSAQEAYEFNWQTLRNDPHPIANLVF